jgi:hypothetical protein
VRPAGRTHFEDRGKAFVSSFVGLPLWRDRDLSGQVAQRIDLDRRAEASPLAPLSIKNRSYSGGNDGWGRGNYEIREIRERREKGSQATV